MLTKPLTALIIENLQDNFDKLHHFKNLPMFISPRAVSSELKHLSESVKYIESCLSEEEFDELLKNKFSDENAFPFEEDKWARMEEMIMADEAKKKRRKIGKQV